MTKVKADGIIEAVRYQENGQILWVRGYLRRGPAWTDRMLLNRETLLDLLISGKKFYTGQRCALLGATFDPAVPLQVKELDKRQLIVAGTTESDKDCLVGVPQV